MRSLKNQLIKFFRKKPRIQILLEEYEIRNYIECKVCHFIQCIKNARITYFANNVFIVLNIYYNTVKLNIMSFVRVTKLITFMYLTLIIYVSLYLYIFICNIYLNIYIVKRKKHKNRK